MKKLILSLLCIIISFMLFFFAGMCFQNFVYQKQTLAISNSYFIFKTLNDNYTLSKPLEGKQLKDFYCRLNKKTQVDYCTKTLDKEKITLALRNNDTEIYSIQHQLVYESKESCQKELKSEAYHLAKEWHAYPDAESYKNMGYALEKNTNNKNIDKILEKIVFKKIPAIQTYKYAASCEMAESKTDKGYVLTRIILVK